MYLCAISVYSGSENKACATGFCWHNFADRVYKEVRALACTAVTAEAWSMEASYTGKLALFYKCGLFSSGERGGGNTTTAGDRASFCYCFCDGDTH